VPNTVAMSFARRRRTRVILGVVAAAVVLVPLAVWFRTSSFVRVEHVRVTGLDGSQASAIRGALTEAALEMTVLDVHDDELKAAVEPYPVVRSLRAKTDFPHGLTITVNAYEPVGALKTGGDLTPVSGDGTLLRGSSARGLATVGIRTAADGGRVRDAEALKAIHLLASAPAPLRNRIAHVYRGPEGLAATLENGPKLYFGGGSRLVAKWEAAAQVLADRTSKGASYVDLRVPERPVAGGLQPRPANSQAQL
jgi:cell division protein FtsQ